MNRSVAFVGMSWEPSLSRTAFTYKFWYHKGMKKPFLRALGVALYIVGIVLVTQFATSFLKNQNETIIIPMTMLSLFVLSAAVVGYLFLSEPLYLLVENRKKEAIVFFAKTVGFFACFVALFTILIFLSSGI